LERYCFSCADADACYSQPSILDRGKSILSAFKTNEISVDDFLANGVLKKLWDSLQRQRHTKLDLDLTGLILEHEFKMKPYEMLQLLMQIRHWPLRKERMNH
jgi:hypothetical protein